MKTRDEELISRSLYRLAGHADPYRGRAPRLVGPKTRRLSAPLLAAVSVAALLGPAALMANHLTGGSDPSVAGSSRTEDPYRSSDRPAGPKRPMILTALNSWAVERADCSTWRPTSRDTVVQVDHLGPECIEKAPRDVMTVFSTSFVGEAPFGRTWVEVTRPWRTLDGHQVRRLSSGPLVEMSSRVVDAVACASCNQVFVVMGPDPEHVRVVVQSVATGD